MFQNGKFQWKRAEKLLGLAKEGSAGLDITNTVRDAVRVVLLDDKLRMQLVNAFTEDNKLHIEVSMTVGSTAMLWHLMLIILQLSEGCIIVATILGTYAAKGWNLCMSQQALWCTCMHRQMLGCLVMSSRALVIRSLGFVLSSSHSCISTHFVQCLGAGTLNINP